MKKTLFAIACGLAPLFILPTGLALIASAFVYASFTWKAFCEGEPWSMTALFLVGYLSLGLLYHAAGMTDVAPLTGLVLYCALAAHAVVRVVAREGVERRIALGQAGVFAVAIAASISLRPHPSYVFVPIALTAIAYALEERVRRWLTARTVWLEREGFRVRLVETAAQREAMNKVIRACYGEIYLKSGLRGEQDGWRRFFGNCHIGGPARHTRYFLVETQSGENIGCFAIYHGRRLPLTDELGLDLGWLQRQAGPVVEIGRLSILPHRRGDGKLWKVIFRAVAEICVRARVGFVVCQAVQHMYPLYRKMGFQPLLAEGEKVQDVEFRMPCVPCYLNIARKMQVTLQSPAMASASPARRQRVERYLNRISSAKIGGLPLVAVIALPPHGHWAGGGQ